MEETQQGRQLSNWEQVQLQDGTVARRYPDGSIRNEKGHPVPGTKIPNDGHEITHANAREYLNRRMELKRSVMAQAANEAVARGDFTKKYGDMAYLAELAYNAQLKAQNIDDPKQIDASRFVVQETGYAETKQAETINNTMNVYEMPPEVAAALVDIRDRLVSRTDILISKVTGESADSRDDSGSPIDVKAEDVEP